MISNRNGQVRAFVSTVILPVTLAGGSSLGCARTAVSLRELQPRHEVIASIGQSAASFVNPQGERTDVHLVTYRGGGSGMGGWESLYVLRMTFLTLGLYAFYYPLKVLLFSRRIHQATIITYDRADRLSVMRSTIDAQAVNAVAAYARCIRTHRQNPEEVEQLCSPLLRNIRFWVGPHTTQT